jgi:hypothetical protein
MRVNVLARDESIAFLSKRTRIDNQAALSWRSCWGPAAGVEEAAAYLEETGERLDEYLELVPRPTPGAVRAGPAAPQRARRSAGGDGKVDRTWALVWHLDAAGKVDRVVNLSGDQHQMDAFFWANFPLKPLPERLVG